MKNFNFLTKVGMHGFAPWWGESVHHFLMTIFMVKKIWKKNNIFSFKYLGSITVHRKGRYWVNVSREIGRYHRISIKIGRYRKEKSMHGFAPPCLTSCYSKNCCPSVFLSLHPDSHMCPLSIYKSIFFLLYKVFFSPWSLTFC